MVRAYGFLACVLRASAILAVATSPVFVVFPAHAAADPAAAPTEASQPSHNASPAWREARGSVAGFTTVKGTETGVLISPQGDTWREIRNGLITPYGGAVLILVAVLIGAFYLRKGTVRLKAQRTGRTIERFSRRERRAHWLVAISFVCLACTGVVLLFGKHIFLWLFGYTLFSWLAWLSKNVHIVAGFSFIVGVVPLFSLFWKDNLWHKSDAEWIRKAGGIATGEHIPSRRFNFGEKAWFWGGLTFFGIVMILSGLALTFPDFFGTRAAMQYAEIVHAVSACLVIAMSLGHIYMGTIGMEGAFDAMKTGKVDEAWAKEHHEIWYEEKMAERGGKV